MTIKACDPCFHGECDRCTSILCACCGEREVATVNASGPRSYDGEENVDYYEPLFL